MRRQGPQNDRIERFIRVLLNPYFDPVFHNPSPPSIAMI
jgi:hypothetical protein